MGPKTDNKDEINDERNEIKIAGRPQEVYVMNIVNKFQTNDQVEIACVHRYLEAAMHIVRLFETFGITPLTKSGKIEFTMKEEDLFNKDTNEKYHQPVYRLTISKHHDHYRFTKI